MLEQGLVLLVQSNRTVAAIAAAGGFLGELPKGTDLPSWSYFVVSDGEQYTLRGRAGLSSIFVQIDCYGSTAAQVILLAKAIDDVLSAFHGALSDEDATGVDHIFRTNKEDFFDDASRTYRRMLEYGVWVYESASSD